MKKSYNFRKTLGRKNIILSLVALVLILMTAVSASLSWIEEVSNVELNSNNGENTPLHIGTKQLKDTVNIQKMNTNSNGIDLNEYFYQGGNMHLSACYSDGENFKFPSSGTMNAAPADYREGTKDDANTNYMSATFKVTSNGAPTAYWLERKGGTNSVVDFAKAGTYTYQNETYATEATEAAGQVGEKSVTVSNTNIEQYLRMSISVNGATTVYAFNDNGAYKTDFNTSVSAADRKSYRDYMYYVEDYDDANPLNCYKNTNNNAANAHKYNQGRGDNLNGNTLFTVLKDETVNVTVKLWLECNELVSSVDVASLNLQIVSGWAKTRRIYIRDMTVDEWDWGLNNGNGAGTGAKWLTKNTNARLYLALYNNDTPASRTHYRMKPTNTAGIYYADIVETTDAIDDVPSVYNGMQCAFYRCNGNWNVGNSHTGDINYWDKWPSEGTLTLPNTYHSEVYSIYSHQYGTWEDETKTINFIDSCCFHDNRLTPSAYLWDSTSVYGTDVNDKVVMNKEFPGEEMTPLNDVTPGNPGCRCWSFFYSSVYDRAVFSDANPNGNRGQYQTQDVILRNKNNDNNNYEGKYFDMSTLDWYYKDSYPTYSNNFLYSEIQGEGNWGYTRFAYGNVNSATGKNILSGSLNTNQVARVYVKYDNSSWKFKVKVGNTLYGYGDSDGGHTLEVDTNLTLYSNNSNAPKIHFPTKGVYKVYLKWDNGNPQIYFDKNPTND